MSVTKSTIRASLLLMSLACSSSWSASSIEALLYGNWLFKVYL